MAAMETDSHLRRCFAALCRAAECQLATVEDVESRKGTTFRERTRHRSIARETVGAVRELANECSLEVPSINTRLCGEVHATVSYQQTRTVRWTFRPATASGRRKSWAMNVTGINPSYDGCQRPSEAFTGNYLREDFEHDLQIGTFVIEVRPEGSVRNGWNEAVVSRVTLDGLEDVGQVFCWPGQLLSIKDVISPP